MSDQAPQGVEKNLPEITIRAVILSVILTIVLAAANAFLGLKLGMTISASIPAAVISMGILRFFKKRKSNPLENNIVQTAASVGEALTAGVAFVLPALLILGYWDDFTYLNTVFVALTGGILGVLFSIPLRRALLADPHLRFPEGTAIGNVLKTNVDQAGDLTSLVRGGVVGSLLALCQGGFEFIASSLKYWFKVGHTVLGFGLGFEPAMMAAGYIVGIGVCVSIFAGILIGWLAGVPLFSYLIMHSSHITSFMGFAWAGDPAILKDLQAPTTDSLTQGSAVASLVWANHVRYIGVGSMLVGGMWTLVTLTKSVIRGLKASFTALRESRSAGYTGVPREERDIPINYVGWALLVMAVVMAFLTYRLVDPSRMGGIDSNMHWLIAIFGVVFILGTGFVISSISAYFAGLVGSSNNPVSGLSVSALLILGLIFYPILAPHIGSLGIIPWDINLARQGDAAICILFVAIIACATAIANDTIQDLKAGQMVGATPWKQQVMLVIGVLISAFVIPEILKLLFDAYGIANILPPRCAAEGITQVTQAAQCGINPSQMLAAPQAGLMAAVAQGVFGQNLPWPEIMLGVVLAVFGVIIDEIVKPRGYRFPVLAMGLGIYLPLSNSTPLIFGGIASYLVNRYMDRKRDANLITDEQVNSGHQSALLLACGIVAGAAVMGVILAIPFSVYQNSDVWKLWFVTDKFRPIAEVLALIMTGGLCVWMYRTAVDKTK
jgi:putative OPT family oligopeptide transporter